MRVWNVVWLLMLAVWSVLSPGHAAAACVGDCNGDGAVTVDELVIMVNVALGAAPASSCAAGDADNNGDITIDEIVAATNNALSTCALPPATPTATQPQATSTPTQPQVTPTPTQAPATPVPTVAALGTRHFVFNPARSNLTAVLSASVPFPLGFFQGQKDGAVGLPAYLDLQAGQPDAQGFTPISVLDASDYFYADATAQAQIVVCIKPIVPVINAGIVACKGGLDFSIGLTQNHHLGEVGIDGFTAVACAAEGGSIESPNQICAAGATGQVCRADSDCANGGAAGVCGLGASICTMPAAAQGTGCRADADCDSAPGSNDGACGQPGLHPGVCNGSYEVGQLGGNSGAGAVSIAPVPQLGLNGLPVELTTERALPCGDEGPGQQTLIALTSATFQSTILNLNNVTSICGAGNLDATCATNADCDSTAGAGDGVCGAIFRYASHGENFSCADWTASDAPGCLVFSAPQLDANPQTVGADLITAFMFCGR